MNKLILFASVFAVITVGMNSCDKVEDPIKPAVELDVSLFPGNWEDYVKPTFLPNTNTTRNIILEDFTGHKCPNCPAAAADAKALEDANPDRVFVASVHAGPGGISTFQELALDCGTPGNPTNKYCTQFYCDESIAYGQAFATGFGFFGNPQGTLNRIDFGGGAMFQFAIDWSAKVDEIITANELKVNIQAASNYYAETNGLFLHTETEFLEDLSAGEYNMVVYLLENDVVDYQDDMGTAIPDYHHHNVFRGCIDGLAWGRTVVSEKTVGAKSYLDYSYKLPAGKTNADYHLLIYVYDVATYEILQVIKHEF